MIGIIDVVVVIIHQMLEVIVEDLQKSLEIDQVDQRVKVDHVQEAVVENINQAGHVQEVPLKVIEILKVVEWILVDHVQEVNQLVLAEEGEIDHQNVLKQLIEVNQDQDQIVVMEDQEKKEVDQEIEVEVFLQKENHLVGIISQVNLQIVSSLP